MDVKIAAKKTVFILVIAAFVIALISSGCAAETAESGGDVYKETEAMVEYRESRSANMCGSIFTMFLNG